jgi:uncharacterized membrane protein YccC
MSSPNPPLPSQAAAVAEPSPLPAAAASPSVQKTNPPGPAQSFWRLLTKFDRSKMLSALLALRNSVGVVLPLVAGYAIGMPRAGLVVASGAINVALSDGSDPYARRAKRMISSSLLCAIAVSAGALSEPHALLAIAIATFWAFLAGLFVSLGQTASDLGSISLVMLLVYVSQPLTPRQALLSGALALAGGLLQTALSIALWPVQRYEPERRALADFFQRLSAIAKSPLVAASVPAASRESALAQQAIAPLDTAENVEAVRYRGLLNQAERINFSLRMLARLRLRMARQSHPHPAVEIVDAALLRASAVLRIISASLLTGNLADPAPFSEIPQLARKLANQAAPAPSAFFAAVLRDAVFQLNALAGQLRASLELTTHTTPAGQAAFDKKESAQPLLLRFSGRLATLRANLSLDSSACRHAIRLAVMVAIGEALGRGFYWRRSYWMPMTIALVLKPEFTTTFSRGLLRIAGTIGGLLVATALFHFLPLTVTSQILLVFVFMFLLRWVGPANYGILAATVGALVVLLLAVAGISPKAVIWERGANTAAGGALALLAYWIWPTWERTRMSERLARMLEAYRAYFHLLADAYQRQTICDQRELDRARMAARVTRSNLEGSLDRLSSEPGTTAEQKNRLNAILASSHRLVYSIMALDAGWAQTPSVSPRPAFLRFAAAVEETFSLLAAALRGIRTPDKDFPDLRESHIRLVESDDGSTQRYALVNVEGDRMTNSLNTLREQILDWISKEPSPERTATVVSDPAASQKPLAG